MQTRYTRLVIIGYDDHGGGLSSDCLVFKRHELGQQRGLEAAKPQYVALVADIAALHDPNSASTLW